MNRFGPSPRNARSDGRPSGGSRFAAPFLSPLAGRDTSAWPIQDENDHRGALTRLPRTVIRGSAPSPAVQERGCKCRVSKLLSRTAGEGEPSLQGLVGEGRS